MRKFIIFTPIYSGFSNVLLAATTAKNDICFALWFHWRSHRLVALSTLRWMDGGEPRLNVTLQSYPKAENSHERGNTSLGLLFKFSIAINRASYGATTKLELVYSFISNFFFLLIGAKANSRPPIKRFEPRGETELLIYQGEADGVLINVRPSTMIFALLVWHTT